MLAGFKREEIRVLVDNHGHLRTRGERPVTGTRWSRFQKDFKLPDNCNADGIRAKFESETLTITLPKKSPSTQVPVPVPGPPPPRTEPRRQAAVQKPPQAIPEPARPAPPPTVPAAPLVPAAPSQKRPTAPSQKPPAERRPSLPRRLPSVPTPEELVEAMKKKAEQAAAAVPKLKDQVKETTKPSSSEDEKRTEREAMGKMAEDRKMVEENKQEAGPAKMMEENKQVQAKQQEAGPAKMLEENKQEQAKQREAGPVIPEMEMARQPRPVAASRGQLVNVAVAVVVLVGITAYVWYTLRNATGGHGHAGTGSYGDEM
jgi:hypothetical protein